MVPGGGGCLGSNKPKQPGKVGPLPGPCWGLGLHMTDPETCWMGAGESSLILRRPWGLGSSGTMPLTLKSFSEVESNAANADHFTLFYKFLPFWGEGYVVFVMILQIPCLIEVFPNKRLRRQGGWDSFLLPPATGMLGPRVGERARGSGTAMLEDGGGPARAQSRAGHTDLSLGSGHMWLPAPQAHRPLGPTC